MKFDLSVLSRQGTNYAIIPSEENSHYIYIVSDNQRLGNEVYNDIIASHDASKKYTTEDFNETIDHLSNDCKSQIKNANFLLVVYNAAGCFVAQTGNTRVLQVRPEEGEIIFDSRNLVLDIYSSKMKTTQLNDYKPGDLLLLCSNNEFETGSLRRVVSNQEFSASDKFSKISGLKEFQQQAILLVKANDVKHPFSLNVLKEIRLAYVGYVALAAVIIALVVWALNSDMLKGSDNDAKVTDEDTLVTTSTVNDADTILTVEKNTSKTVEAEEENNDEEKAEKKKADADEDKKKESDENRDKEVKKEEKEKEKEKKPAEPEHKVPVAEEPSHEIPNEN